MKLCDQDSIPIVISRSIEIPQLSCLVVDYTTASSQAIKYLLSLNHKRIACISGLPEWDSSKIILESVRQTLSEAGLRLPSHLYRWCFPNIEEGSQLASNLLNLPEKKRSTAFARFRRRMCFSPLTPTLSQRERELVAPLRRGAGGEVSKSAVTIHHLKLAKAVVK